MHSLLAASFHNPALASIADSILWALKHVVYMMWLHLADALLYIAYAIFVWAPLHVINAMVIIFRFFSQGLMPYVFGTSINADGSIHYNFNWSSPLAHIMYFVLGISMIMFTFFFMLTFTKNQTVDENGRPTMMQSKRIYYLKWPMMIFLLMVGTPIILTLFDTFISLLLTPFGASSIGSVVSRADLDQIHNNVIDPFHQNSGSFFLCGQVGLLDINGSSLNARLADLLSQTNIFKQVVQDNPDTNFYGVDSTYLVPLQNDINSVITYLNSGFNDDLSKVSSAVSSIKVGQYISADQATPISTAMAHLLLLHDNLWAIGGMGSRLDTDSDLITAITNCTTCSQGTSNGWSAVLFATTLSQISLQTTTAGSDLNNYLAIDGTSSFLATTLYGNDTTIGLTQLEHRTIVGEPFQLVQYLYIFISPDKNPANWESQWQYNTSFTNEDGWMYRINYITFLLGIFLLFAMILIMYNFVSSSIKRVYLTVGYWIIGWILMANGINNPQQVKKWYRSLFGQYFTILVMFVGFQLASVVLDLIRTPILDGMDKAGDWSNVGNWMGQAACLFAAEAAYQVAWQLSQDYAGTWGAQDQKFSAASSMALTQGKGGAGKTLSHLWGTASIRPIRKAVTSWNSTTDWWKDRKNKKNQRGNNEFTHVNSQLDLAAGIPQKKAADAGLGLAVAFKHDQQGKGFEPVTKGAITTPSIAPSMLSEKDHPKNMSRAQQDQIGYDPAKGLSADKHERDLQLQAWSSDNPNYFGTGGAGTAMGFKNKDDMPGGKHPINPENFVPGTKLDPLKDPKNTKSLWGTPIPPAAGHEIDMYDQADKHYKANPGSPTKSYGDMPGYVKDPQAGVPNESLPYTLQDRKSPSAVEKTMSNYYIPGSVSN